MIAREILVIVLVFLRSFRRTFAGPFDIPPTETAGQNDLSDLIFEGVEKWGLGEGMEGAVSGGDGESEGENEGEGEDAFQCDMYLAQSLVPGLGRGVFAGRDFMRNEMIDRAPSLHVLHDHITNTQVITPPSPILYPLPPLCFVIPPALSPRRIPLHSNTFTYDYVLKIKRFDSSYSLQVVSKPGKQGNQRPQNI